MLRGYDRGRVAFWVGVVGEAVEAGADERKERDDAILVGESAKL